MSQCALAFHFKPTGHQGANPLGGVADWVLHEPNARKFAINTLATVLLPEQLLLSQTDIHTGNDTTS